MSGEGRLYPDEWSSWYRGTEMRTTTFSDKLEVSAEGMLWSFDREDYRRRAEGEEWSCYSWIHTVSFVYTMDLSDMLENMLLFTMSTNDEIVYSFKVTGHNRLWNQWGLLEKD